MLKDEPSFLDSDVMLFGLRIFALFVKTAMKQHEQYSLKWNFLMETIMKLCTMYFVSVNRLLDLNKQVLSFHYTLYC